MFFKLKCFPYFRWPIFVTFYFTVLFGFSKIKNQPSIFFQNHPPKVFFRLWQRALRCDESLVIDLDCRIYVVGVNIRVVYICGTLHKPYFCMFEWFEVWISVHVRPCSLLVVKMFFCLSQLPQQSKFCIKISDKRLPFVIVQRNALLQQFYFIKLLHPFIRQILRWLWALDKHILVLNMLPTPCLFQRRLFNFGNFKSFLLRQLKLFFF